MPDALTDAIERDFANISWFVRDRQGMVQLWWRGGNQEFVARAKGRKQAEGHVARAERPYLRLAVEELNRRLGPLREGAPTAEGWNVKETRAKRGKV